MIVISAISWAFALMKDAKRFRTADPVPHKPYRKSTITYKSKQAYKHLRRHLRVRGASSVSIDVTTEVLFGHPHGYSNADISETGWL